MIISKFNSFFTDASTKMSLAPWIFIVFNNFWCFLETLDQRAFNALFRVPNNVSSEKVPPLYENDPKTFRFCSILGFWVQIRWRLSYKRQPGWMESNFNGVVRCSNPKRRRHAEKMDIDRHTLGISGNFKGFLEVGDWRGATGTLI